MNALELADWLEAHAGVIAAGRVQKDLNWHDFDYDDIEKLRIAASEFRAFAAMSRALRQALEEAQAGMTWRPIETAPTDGTYVLLASSAHGRLVGAHVTGDVWHLIGVGVVNSKSERPTHWMPLPAPPAKEAE